MLFVCHPKFYVSIVFSFSWGHFNCQQKLKTMLVQNCGVRDFFIAFAKNELGSSVFQALQLQDFAYKHVSQTKFCQVREELLQQPVCPTDDWLRIPLYLDSTYLGCAYCERLFWTMDEQTEFERALCESICNALKQTALLRAKNLNKS